MEIQKWEYKIFQGHFEKEYGQTLLFFMDGSGHISIDDWGYDGWELVAVAPCGPEDTEYILKRPV